MSKKITNGGRVDNPATNDLLVTLIKRQIEQYVEDSAASPSSARWKKITPGGQTKLSRDVSVVERAQIDQELTNDTNVDMLTCVLCGTTAILNINGLRQHFFEDHHVKEDRLYEFLHATKQRDIFGEEKDNALSSAQRLNMVVGKEITNVLDRKLFDAEVIMAKVAKAKASPSKVKKVASPRTSHGSHSAPASTMTATTTPAVSGRDSMRRNVGRPRRYDDEEEPPPKKIREFATPVRKEKVQDSIANISRMGKSKSTAKAHGAVHMKASGLKMPILHVPKIGSNEMIIYTTFEKALRCQLCRDDEQIQQPYRHALKHDECAPYACTECTHCTNTRELMLEHLSRTHGGSCPDRLHFEEGVLLSEAFYDSVQRCFGPDVAATARQTTKDVVRHVPRQDRSALFTNLDNMSLLQGENGLMDGESADPNALHVYEDNEGGEELNYMRDPSAPMIADEAYAITEPRPCLLCGQVVLPESMYEHIWWHVDKKRLFCVQEGCDYASVLQEQMIEHYEAVHDPSLEVQCASEDDAYKDMFDETVEICFGEAGL